MIDAQYMQGSLSGFSQRRWVQISLRLCPNGALMSLQAQAENFVLLLYLSFHHRCPVIKNNSVTAKCHHHTHPKISHKNIKPISAVTKDIPEDFHKYCSFGYL